MGGKEEPILKYYEDAGQIAELRRGREKTPGENPLLAMKKTDRLTPVLNLVLYLGEDRWDAADHLHGILNMEKVPEELRSYIPDYNISVLDIRRLPDERLLEFPDDIACMFLIIKYEKDATRLKAVMQNVPAFRKMDAEVYDTVWHFVDDHRMLDQKDGIEDENGGVNMCKAIDDIYAEGIEKGRVRGKAEGRAEGKAGEIGIIRRMFTKNVKTETVAEILGFSNEYVLRVYTMFREYPEESDIQIAVRSLACGL